MQRAALVLGLVCALHGSATWWARANAQGFNRRYDAIGSGLSQMGWGVEEKQNGEFLIVGNSEWIDWVDSLYYSSRVLSGRLDSEGDTLGTHSFAIPLRATYPGSSNSLIILTDGRVVSCGSTVDTVGVHRVAFFWFDASGSAQNYIEVNLSGNWIGRQLKATSDGGFIIVGDADILGTPEDGFLLKTDSLGNVQWWQTYGGAATRDFFFSVDLAPLGGYYIGGVTQVSSFTYDPWLLRCDSTGALVWEFTHGTTYEDFSRAQVTSLADGNIIVGAGLPSGTFGNQWAQLFKVDSVGTIVWEQIYDEDSYTTSLSQVKEIVPNGDLIACGWSYITNEIDGILLRTNNQGDSIWMRHYFYYDSLMNDGTGLFRDVEPTDDGGFIAVGAVFGSASGNNPPGYTQDIWVVKVDSLGCIEPGCQTITGLQSQVTNLRVALRVWPNPVTSGGNATVQVQLPEALRSSALRLVLVNAQGQLVREQVARQGENMLHLSSVAAGLYHVHLANATTWLGGTKLIVE